MFFAIGIMAVIFSTPAFAQVTDQPSVLRAVPPVFPLPAGGPNAMGTVVVEAQIGTGGDVIEAKALQGHPALYHTAEAAALRWLFSALDGRAKVRTVRLTFVFKFMDDGTPDEDLLPLFEPPYQIEVRRVLPMIRTKSAM
jgi:hypothetical protein